MADRIAVIGAGLCGNLIAIMLARLGFDLTVYERQAAPGATGPATGQAAGRSINMALAARGIRALKHAEAFADIESLLLPMNGRFVHRPDGTEKFLPYGQHRDECIWSVSRLELNDRLIAIARDRLKVDYRFEHRCVDYDAERASATMQSTAGEFTIEPRLLLAADGAGSTIRRKLAAAGAVAASEDLLDHGYKELTIPPDADGHFALAATGLHIWPRGGFMLIALPNLDQSFTATLFLPYRGQPGFDGITGATVGAFFAEHFPDSAGLMPDLAAEFPAKPVGELGSVHCEPWSLTAGPANDRHVLLLGDAAHAIVPFHGQGMNAAFEDCVEFARLVAENGPDWQDVMARFETARRHNARAIAEMALQNYEEMRDTVRNPDFDRRASLSFELERRFPGRFIPRYSMVMFHPEIGYAEAMRRGDMQTAILDQALLATDEATSLRVASALVESSL
jgi:kynurenine 3-monooxygenase